MKKEQLSYKEIPQHVKELAEKIGMMPGYFKEYQGADIYKNVAPCEGQPLPTRLPMFISYKDGVATIISGIFIGGPGITVDNHL